MNKKAITLLLLLHVIIRGLAQEAHNPYGNYHRGRTMDKSSYYYSASYDITIDRDSFYFDRNAKGKKVMNNKLKEKNHWNALYQLNDDTIIVKVKDEVVMKLLPLGNNFDSLAIIYDNSISENKIPDPLIIFRTHYYSDDEKDLLYEKSLRTTYADDGRFADYYVYQYDTNGRIVNACKYFDTEKSGKEIAYIYDNNQAQYIIYKGRWRKGKKNGKWIYYSANGLVEREEKWKHGIKVE